MRVGIAGSPPFIMSGAQSQSGIAYEVWTAIADAENWDFTTQRFNTVSDALSALKDGQLDLVVGPVSITSERVETMDFSQPYYFSGLSIMSRKDEPTLFERIQPFFSMKLLVAVVVFLFILAIVGTLIWLAERKKSPEQFPPDITHGIANGMWLAIVTMSTTGYGDRAPITLWGRIIAGCWMVISIIFATSMVAGIASTLTLTGMGSNTITEARQLTGKTVATPSFQVSKSFLDEFKAKAVKTQSLTEAYQLLQQKKVAAIVFDRPQLLYFQKEHPSDNIIVSRSVYDPTGYGFAFPLKSPLIKKVNIRMLQLNELGSVKHIIKAWIDAEN
ncbi:transporter substrate-binding domain-containing protein [Arachidicoccus terrestris]|uniref:transporter substrate-binding domain-containing protein n=1 Tax=Arachidicoccus terrestris TaxID=2875539 RepID=UPI001CC7E4C1|nr:transporter substrate-binding domain-containing protein [Arachidicoccus terrestris]UAY55376.1 transporter substrate-binding domain-containing protein [Arachidicoccus terrestris]